MTRYAMSAIAVAVMTTGAAPGLHAEAPILVTLNRWGEYCITQRAVGPALVDPTECHTADVWAKQGVSFSRRPGPATAR